MQADQFLTVLINRATIAFRRNLPHGLSLRCWAGRGKENL
jgi:hypothetical protein